VLGGRRSMASYVRTCEAQSTTTTYDAVPVKRTAAEK
jgi:hypothetical protein